MPARAGTLRLVCALCAAAAAAAAAAAESAAAARSAAEYRHSGGGLTSVVMASIISKLPPVSPPTDGVRDGDKLMRTVRLSGAYQSDVPIILPSFTRLVLDGSMEALPSDKPGQPGLHWTLDSAGSANETASMVSVKGGQMVSIEGGSWSCANWNGLSFSNYLSLD